MYKFVQKNTQNLLKIDNDIDTLLLRYIRIRLPVVIVDIERMILFMAKGSIIDGVLV